MPLRGDDGQTIKKRFFCSLVASKDCVLMFSTVGLKGKKLLLIHLDFMLGSHFFNAFEETHIPFEDVSH